MNKLPNIFDQLHSFHGFKFINSSQKKIAIFTCQTKYSKKKQHSCAVFIKQHSCLLLFSEQCAFHQNNLFEMFYC